MAEVNNIILVSRPLTPASLAASDATRRCLAMEHGVDPEQATAVTEPQGEFSAVFARRLGFLLIAEEPLLDEGVIGGKLWVPTEASYPADVHLPFDLKRQADKFRRRAARDAARMPGQHVYIAHRLIIAAITQDDRTSSVVTPTEIPDVGAVVTLETARL